MCVIVHCTTLIANGKFPGRDVKRLVLDRLRMQLETDRDIPRTHYNESTPNEALHQ